MYLDLLLPLNLSIIVPIAQSCLNCLFLQSVGESRWSKYTETVATLDGDEEEEGNVSTESKRFGSQRNNRSVYHNTSYFLFLGC